MNVKFDFRTKRILVYNKNGLYRRGIGITPLIAKWFFHERWSLQSQSGSRGGGSELGRRVDKELKSWTKAIVKEQSNKIINKKVAKFCTETKMVIKECEKRGWRPVDSQRLVGCYDSSLATRCDLVLRNILTQEFILLEIKTGYADTFNNEEHKGKEEQRMRPPFFELKANPRRFALIQLLLTWILHSTTHPEIKIKHENVRVLHVTTEKVSTYQLPIAWSLQVRQQLLSYMKRKHTKKKQVSRKRFKKGN